MRKDFKSKAIACGLAVAMTATTAVALPTDTVSAKTNVNSITLNAKKATLYVGQKKTIKVSKVNGKTATKSNKAVTYVSSNKKVAKVTKKGVIKAIKKGKATITVKSKYNKKATAKVKVTVKQQVKSITVTNAISNKIAVRKGKKLKIKTSLTPKNVNSKKLTYKSKNTKIVKVTKKGNLKGIKKGKTKVVITAAYGAKKKAKKTITVIVPKTVVKSISSKAQSATLTPGTTTKITNTIAPSNATVKLAFYTSSNNTVATVDGNGVVTAVAPGTATITVKTLDGYLKSNVTITVAAKASASSQTATAYKYSLDKNAKSYDIMYAGLAYNVSKDALISDIQTLAKTFADTKFDPVKFVSDLSVDTLCNNYKIFASNNTLVSQIVSISGTGAEKKVTVQAVDKKATFNVTADVTSMKVAGVTLSDINVKVVESTGDYIWTAKTSTANSYQIKVSKDYNSIQVVNIANNTSKEVMSVKVVEGGVEASIDKAFYNEISAKYPTAGLLESITINNVY